MKPKLGMYFYSYHRRSYRIYQYTRVDDGFTVADPVQGEREYTDPAEARRRVYELNGWRL